MTTIIVLRRLPFFIFVVLMMLGQRFLFPAWLPSQKGFRKVARTRMPWQHATFTRAIGQVRPRPTHRIRSPLALVFLLPQLSSSQWSYHCRGRKEGRKEERIDVIWPVLLSDCSIQAGYTADAVCPASQLGLFSASTMERKLGERTHKYMRCVFGKKVSFGCTFIHHNLFSRSH